MPLMVNAGNNTESFITGFKSKGSRNEKIVRHIKLDFDNAFTSFYNYGKTLGRGNFGTVYEVMDVRDGSSWALKFIEKQALSPNYMKALEREINILKILNHPHIISLREIFESTKTLYLILEKCEGDLTTILHQNKRTNEPVTKRIIKDLASAVTYLHKNNIVHRDIKLENILVTKNPDDENDKLYLKLSDFGLSIIKVGNSYSDMLHERCGTLAYMAPEILLSQSYSQQCDVWAIGVIMYLLTTGSMPFVAQNDQGLVEKVCNKEPRLYDLPLSPDGIDILGKLLCKNPAIRITATEILCHPWISENPPSGSGKPKNVLEMMRMWNDDLKAIAAPANEVLTLKNELDKRSGNNNRYSVTNKPRDERPSLNLPIHNIEFSRDASLKNAKAAKLIKKEKK